MSEHRRTLLNGRSAQASIAAILSVAAGASTGWFSNTTFVVLAIIAVTAFLIVFGTPRASLGGIVIGALVSAVAVRLPELGAEAIVEGLVWGLIVVLILGGPLTIRRVVEQHRAFQQRGWDIAALQAQRRASETREALQRERMSLAAEMHDGLGHALTLIAVRLGQLSVKPSLASTDRQHVTEIRQIAADAADELGLAVRLLRTSDSTTAEWATPALEDLINGARKAGIKVTAEVPEGYDDDLSEEVRTALIRVVQEGLTNAAKHAPSQPVRVRIIPTQDKIRAVISNKLLDIHSEASDSGFGLIGLQHRAEMLGGELTTATTSESYTLTLTLPRHARPVAPIGSDTDKIREAKTTIADHRSKATRLAVALPVVVVTTMAVVMLAYFVVVNALSTLSTAEFQAIEVGDERAITEKVLPPFEIFDPPRDQFPARPEEECLYYENDISFFERLDVFVVCFSGDKVSRKGTVPSP